MPAMIDIGITPPALAVSGLVTAAFDGRRGPGGGGPRFASLSTTRLLQQGRGMPGHGFWQGSSGSFNYGPGFVNWRVASQLAVPAFVGALRTGAAPRAR